MSSTRSILIAGVGGQGIILCSEILSDALLLAGFDVKKSEIHGMSQRGGSVTSHIRYGTKVYSPIIPDGTADVILAFERLEAVRELTLLAASGTVIVNNESIMPTTTVHGGQAYPDDIEARLKKKASRVIMVDAANEAKALGNARVFNTILLGVLARELSVADDIFEKAIGMHVAEQFRTLNIQAFARGKTL
ncbi:MAG: indolepyruvate oxidoreductase subunit beta [Spirochaetota bacterium]